MAQKKPRQTSLSNLSMALISEGLELLQTKAFRVYKLNIDRRGPPIAGSESSPAGIAILLIMTGLDYHLARTKYLRDIALRKSPLPYTPYFSWQIGDSLFSKLENLLVRRNQKTLKEQLIEITCVRDSIAHPKLYEVTQEFIGDESAFGKSSASLVSGLRHKEKTIARKMVKREYTKLLRLPLVPDWISYRDAVLALMVVTRMIYWMEREYGNPYAWVGHFCVRNKPPDFFPSGNDTQTRSISLTEWTRTFFRNLSATDQEVVRRRLKGNLDKYMEKPPIRFHRRRGRAFFSMLDDFQDPEPHFLSQPPSPKWIPVKGAKKNAPSSSKHLGNPRSS